MFLVYNLTVIMNIAISGATGFIGKHLTDYFAAQGHRVIPLVRSMFRENMSGQLSQTLSRCDAVINLAGAPINRRWTARYKRELYDSRVHLTRKLVQALQSTVRKPSLFISVSAVGYYPSNGVFDEYTGIYGDDFLAELCHAWEKEVTKCPASTRWVITRLAVVLAPDGGALKQMMMPLKGGVALTIGPGNQSFPWIGMHDLCRAFQFIVERKELRGVVNLIAPELITQREFTRTLARKRHAWLRLKVPAFVLRMVMGEAASFLISGQCVRPTRLEESGYTFDTPTIEQFLEDTWQQEEVKQ